MVPGSIEALFRNQIFLNRSGDIIFQIAPHCLIDDKKTGTAHDTPYSDNTHVPLILYQQGVYEQKQSLIASILHNLQIVLHMF